MKDIKRSKSNERLTAEEEALLAKLFISEKDIAYAAYLNHLGYSSYANSLTYTISTAARYNTISDEEAGVIYDIVRCRLFNFDKMVI